jgi:hypothetical protein
LNRWVPIEFFTSLAASFVLYPVLRLATVRRRTLVTGGQVQLP